MAWVCLFTAALFEIGWAIGLKYAQGFTQFWASCWTCAAMILSFTLLAVAVRTIPIGTGYAIWTGIGAVGASVGGMILFGESVTPLRILCLMCIVCGVVGLKWAAV